MPARAGGISLSNLVTVHSGLLLLLVMVVVLVLLDRMVVLLLLDRMVLLLLRINSSCMGRKLSLLSSPTVKDRPPSGCGTARVAVIALLLLLLLLLLHLVVMVVIGSLLLLSFGFCYGVGHGDVVVDIFSIIVTSKAHFECVIGLPFEHDRTHVV